MFTDITEASVVPLECRTNFMAIILNGDFSNDVKREKYTMRERKMEIV
jgi:hypothetical protein